jgi:hypothetical protein
MPNYEIVRKKCECTKKEVACPATYVSEHRGAEKLVEHINDCLSKEHSCMQWGCKFCGGTKDPFSV